MIINTEQSNVQVIGDVKEFKTSIDPKNLEFITTLLSSNLYSNPEQSFIREIVSNAWDSHVEAETTKTPVIIDFSNNSNDTWDISIRDFGTGLSPKRFKEIFCNIGSSTKRDSNNYIGGFGIGRYSALACSNTVYITSYYNGTYYLYVMVKDGNTITTNLIIEKPTEEKNGVEVTIKGILNINPYKEALRNIVFFPNIYINGVCGDINAIKVKRFKNFAAATVKISNKILLGNVLYPCDRSLLSNEACDFLAKIEYSGIVIKFDVGELNITPNRESIIYNKETIEKIEDRINSAEKELQDLVNKRVVKDSYAHSYSNLYDFWKINYKDIIYFPIEDSYISYTYRSNCTGFITHINPNVLTFNGRKINITNAWLNILQRFFGTEIINFRGMFYNDKYYRRKIPIDACNYMRAPKILMLVNTPKITQPMKDWLHYTYNNYVIVNEFTKDDFKTYVVHNISDLLYYTEASQLIDDMYDYIKGKIIPLEVNKAPGFITYKETLKRLPKKSNFNLNDVIIYKFINRDYRVKLNYCNIETCIKEMKKWHRGVIVSGMSETIDWYSIAVARGFVYIKAKKAVIDAFNKIKPSFIVDKISLFNDSVASKLYTIQEVFKNSVCPSVYNCNSFFKILPSTLSDEFKEVVTFYEKYRNDSTYLSMVKTKCINVDSYTKYICEKLKKYFNIWLDFKAYLRINDYSADYIISILVTAMIIKTKSFRVNLNAYKKVKNNKIISILCKN